MMARRSCALDSIPSRQDPQEALQNSGWQLTYSDQPNEIGGTIRDAIRKKVTTDELDRADCVRMRSSLTKSCTTDLIPAGPGTRDENHSGRRQTVFASSLEGRRCSRPPLHRLQLTYKQRERKLIQSITTTG